MTRFFWVRSSSTLNHYNTTSTVEITVEENGFEGEPPLQKRILEKIKDDWKWSMYESHEMISAFLCPLNVLEMPIEDRVQCWAIRKNPIYWGSVYATAWCVITGKWLHALFGQDGPVRPDESHVEHEARVIFIYSTDGPIAVSALFTACWILILRFHGNLGDNAMTAANTFDLLVDFSYILGNVFFVEAMRRRKCLLVRCAVVSNATFALGLSVLLVLGIFDSNMYDDTTYAWQRAITWSIRFLVVLFLAAGTYVYAQLWDLYRPNVARENVVCLQYVAIITSALLIWILLFFIVSNGKAPYLWDVFT